ncbi:MAG: hypothetical protein E7359_03020 [Clostridiales bacterium]|nr:hypothetical protein [Clostridiales bacterium]
MENNLKFTISTEETDNAYEILDKACIDFLENNCQITSEILVDLAKSFWLSEVISQAGNSQFEFAITDLVNELGQPKTVRGCCIGGDLCQHVYISKENVFDKAVDVPNIVGCLITLYHELTHARTNIVNKNISFRENENYKAFASQSDVGNLLPKELINTDIDYSIYYNCSDENSARYNGLLFTTKLLKRARETMQTNEKYLTEENIAFFQQCKDYLVDKEIKEYEEFVELCDKRKILMSSQIRELTLKYFDKIKMLEQNPENIYKELESELIYKYYNFIRAYLVSYIDDNMYKMIVDYAQDNRNSIFYRCYEELLNLRHKNYTVQEQDQVLLNFDINYDDLNILKHVSASDMAKFLVFYNQKPFSVFTLGCNINYSEFVAVQNEMENIKSQNKNIIFNGIPIIKSSLSYEEILEQRKTRDMDFSSSIVWNTDDNCHYYLEINGIMHTFDTEKEALIEASKYVSSDIIDNLTEENIDYINSIFGSEIIHVLTEEEIRRAESEELEIRRLQEERERNDTKNKLSVSKKDEEETF